MTEITIVHNDGSTERHESYDPPTRDGDTLTIIDVHGAEVIASLANVATVRII